MEDLIARRSLFTSRPSRRPSAFPAPPPAGEPAAPSEPPPLPRTDTPRPPPSPPPVADHILRAPTPPPMLPRRGVPIPARRLDLEVVATERSSELSGPVLDSYARNQEEAADQDVRVLRDLPFGDAFAPEDTPFFLADTQPHPVEVDDSDTDGIPVGLPDLIGFTDVEARVAEPTEAPVVQASPAASTTSPVVVGVALVVGLVVGAAGMWLVG